MLILSLGNKAASAVRRLAFANIPIYSSVYYMNELTTRFVWEELTSATYT